MVEWKERFVEWSGQLGLGSVVLVVAVDPPSEVVQRMQLVPPSEVVLLVVQVVPPLEVVQSGLLVVEVGMRM